MSKKLGHFIILLTSCLLLSTTQSFADTINLNSPGVLGNLSLTGGQLKAIQDAVVSAMESNIDDEKQCGAVKGDCVVRAAREWKYEGSTFREIVIEIHTIGHASITVENAKGKWTTIATK